jgi:hypothetical protein
VRLFKFHLHLKSLHHWNLPEKKLIFQCRIELNLNGFVWIISEILGAVTLLENRRDCNDPNEQVNLINVRVQLKIVRVGQEFRLSISNLHLVRLVRPS